MYIEDVEQEIIDEFAMFEDWSDKYQYIIDLGKELSPMNEANKSKENIVKGCQATVWLHATLKDGHIYFEADSDAMIVKGLISLLVRVLSGRTMNEILNADLAFIDKIGMREHLSATRSNGLAAMIKQMKFYAIAFNSKATQS